MANGANDPRWNAVGELRDEAKRISDEAIEAYHAKRITAGAAMAAIERAHTLNQQATALIIRIGATWQGQAVTHLPQGDPGNLDGELEPPRGILPQGEGHARQ